MKCCLFIFVFCLSIGVSIHCQTTNLFKLADAGSIEIPFDYTNNFIVVKVRFNHLFPLRFIFDTGAEHTILSKKEVTDLMGIPYVREFRIIGSDLKKELIAHLIQGIHLEVGEASVPNQSLLVLEEDYFSFEEFAGIQIHGILGANFFRGFVVKINFDQKVITLQSSQRFHPPGNQYTNIPVSIFKNKPYLNTNLSLRRGQDNLPVKLLIDTGASLSMLLHTNTKEGLKMPENIIRGNIGSGLGGHLEGYLGRIQILHLDKLQLNDVVTNFQEITEEMDTSYLNGRNGILGNQILSRFTVIIDYPKEMMYLRPNRKFSQKFEFDMSGLSIIAGGLEFNEFTIQEVFDNSPAAEAGLMADDRILAVNGIPTWMNSLEELTRKLKKKEGKKIKMKIRRKKTVMRVQFKLRKLI